MDVVQKVRDLSNTAFDERGNVNERLGHAVAALRLVEQFLLPKDKKKKIEVDAAAVAEILDKIPLFVDAVASGAAKIADSFDRALGSVGRVIGSVKRVSDSLSQSGVGESAPARGRRGGKRRYSSR